MSENWERPGAIYALPSSATKYERLNREIDAPRVTEGSTVLFDYNRLSVRRRALWMKQNGLGLQESYPAFRPEFAS